MNRLFCSIFIAFFGGFLFAQDASLQRSIDRSAAIYLNIVNEESALYYGHLQEDLPLATNHPYLHDPQYAKARLTYFGVVYPEAMLRLDLGRQELVVLSPDSRNIVLFPENVDVAELHGQRVIYFQPDNLPGCPPAGYYCLLHSANCKVMKRQNATLNRKDAGANGMEQYYIITTRFYLYQNGAYCSIRNKRGLLQALHPYKKELKQFISANHLSFRKHPEELLVQTVVEYEKLSGLQ